jgi:hypothetical protein
MVLNSKCKMMQNSKWTKAKCATHSNKKFVMVPFSCRIFPFKVYTSDEFVPFLAFDFSNTAKTVMEGVGDSKSVPRYQRLKLVHSLVQRLQWTQVIMEYRGT